VTRSGHCSGPNGNNQPKRVLLPWYCPGCWSASDQPHGTIAKEPNMNLVFRGFGQIPDFDGKRALVGHCELLVWVVAFISFFLKVQISLFCTFPLYNRTQYMTINKMLHHDQARRKKMMTKNKNGLVGHGKFLVCCWFLARGVGLTVFCVFSRTGHTTLQSTRSYMNTKRRS
jgi:hypothetical protein